MKGFNTGDGYMGMVDTKYIVMKHIEENIKTISVRFRE